MDGVLTMYSLGLCYDPGRSMLQCVVEDRIKFILDSSGTYQVNGMHTADYQRIYVMS